MEENEMRERLGGQMPAKVSGECPVCGCHDVSFGSLEVEGEPEFYVVQTAYCQLCETAWHDVYGLEGNMIDDLGEKVPQIEFKVDGENPDNPRPFQALIEGRIEGEATDFNEARKIAIRTYLERKEAEEEAELANDPEEPTGLLLNKYKCTCGHFWADVYDCAVDDECPKCGLDISPYDSEEVKR